MTPHEWEYATYTLIVGDADYFECIVSESAPYKYTWNDWADIADLAGEINFDCQFDDGGKCKGIRHPYHSDPKGWKDRGCCCDCAKTKGFLRVIPIEALETVEREYNEDTGFWRSSGCALPRKWRSATCLAHKCGTYTPDDVDEDDVDEAWSAFFRLLTNEDYQARPVARIKVIMQEAQLLQIFQLVTLS